MGDGLSSTIRSTVSGFSYASRSPAHVSAFNKALVVPPRPSWFTSCWRAAVLLGYVALFNCVVFQDGQVGFLRSIPASAHRGRLWIFNRNGCMRCWIWGLVCMQTSQLCACCGQ
eukprot:7575142-Pyramimonas_sp.AAC.1